MTQRKRQKKPQKRNNQLIYVTIGIIIILIAIVSAIAMTQNNDSITDSMEKDNNANNTENDGTWLFAMDSDNVASKYKASAIPTLIIVDKKGNIVLNEAGQRTKKYLDPLIESAEQGTANDLGEAPDFSVTTFNDETFTLSDYRGKVVLIDLMAEYCGPCIRQMPELQKIKLEKGEDIALISIDVSPYETESIVRETFGEYIKED